MDGLMSEGLGIPSLHAGCHVREDLRLSPVLFLHFGFTWWCSQYKGESAAAPCGLSPLQAHLKVLSTVVVEFVATLGDIRVRWKISGRTRD